MSLRLQEIHPAVVHFPIALIPAALGLDAIGRATGKQGLMDAGRALMPVAAASAVVSAAAGVLAQGALRYPDETGRELLVTHSHVNAVVTAGTIALAALRWRRGGNAPSNSYLAAGAGILAAIGYSASLGGKMVYEHGLGVKPAGGVIEERAPEIKPGQLGHAVKVAGADVAEATRQSVQALKDGEIAPETRVV